MKKILLIALMIPAVTFGQTRMKKVGTTYNGIDTINTATSTYFVAPRNNTMGQQTVQVDVTKYSGTVNVKAVLLYSDDGNDTHLYHPVKVNGLQAALSDTLSFGDVSGSQSFSWTIPAASNGHRYLGTRLISTGTQGVIVKCWVD